MVNGLEDVRMGGVEFGVLETSEKIMKWCKLEMMKFWIEIVGQRIEKKC